MASLSISGVEVMARDIVLALDASDYAQAGISAAWTEMLSFDLMVGPASTAHLRFHAAAQQTATTEGRRGRGYTEEQVESGLAVTFAYHLRPGYHAEDLRSAHDAAQDVVRGINRSCQDDWSTLFARISTGVDAERGLAIITVEFRIIHTIEV